MCQDAQVMYKLSVAFRVSEAQEKHNLQELLKHVLTECRADSHWTVSEVCVYLPQTADVATVAMYMQAVWV